MTKTYLLEEAKELVKNGKVQIHNDCKNNLTKEKHDILYEVCGKMGQWEYYTFDDCHSSPFNDLEIIPLSSIQDIKWGDEVQGTDDLNYWGFKNAKFVAISPIDGWYLVENENGITRWRYIRLPEPDLKSLQEKLQSQLDQELKGYKVVIQKEK